MAKIDIRHRCGHLNEWNLIGNAQSRHTKTVWLANGLCRSCYREEQLRCRREREREAIKASLGLGFPIPAGAENSIREAIVVRLHFYETACRTVGVEKHREMRRIISRERMASFWLDRRHDSPRMVLNAIVARHPELVKK